MLKELQRLVETGELEAESVPSLQQIKSWISRFSQRHKNRQLKTRHLINKKKFFFSYLFLFLKTINYMFLINKYNRYTENVKIFI